MRRLELVFGAMVAALAAFVAEHARNAGPTLYRLTFQPDADDGAAESDPLRRTVAEVRARPEQWLEEGRSTLVVR